MILRGSWGISALLVLCLASPTFGQDAILESPDNTTIEFDVTKHVRSRSWIWEPKEDITAYELAKLLPFFIIASSGNWYPPEQWDAWIKGLGTAVRHLREVE
jgi:hypothetical protein